MAIRAKRVRVGRGGGMRRGERRKKQPGRLQE